MNKNDNIHTLLKTLTDTLPYEYNEELIDNGTTILITKEDSDLATYLTLDDDDVIAISHDDPDDVIAIGHDDPNRGYYVEYEPIYQSSEDGQIPLDTILTDIKNSL